MSDAEQRLERMSSDVGRMHGLLAGALARRRLPSATTLLKTAEVLRELAAEFECLAKEIIR